MHCHQLLGFRGDMLAAIQLCFHSRFHTTQSTLCSCCMFMQAHVCSVKCEYPFFCSFFSKNECMHFCLGWARSLMSESERYTLFEHSGRCALSSVILLSICAFQICMLSRAEKASLCVTVIVFFYFISWLEMHTDTQCHAGLDKAARSADPMKGTTIKNKVLPLSIQNSQTQRMSSVGVWIIKLDIFL